MKRFSRWTFLLSRWRWWSPIVTIYGLGGLYDFIAGQFVDDLPRLGDIMPWYWWSLGVLAILLGLTFEGSYRQYRSHAVSPYDSVVSELARKSYMVGGEPKDGDELFMELAPLFREPISESNMFSYLWNEIAEHNERQMKAGASPISGQDADAICRSVASRILSDWFTLSLLDRETINPAPGAAGSIRQSRHDFPYTAYCLSAQGKAVFQFLKKRT